MNVKLLAHTQLTEEFKQLIYEMDLTPSDGQAVAFTAIRTCYAPGEPSDVIRKEGAKYFGNQATDGQGGSEADRLIRHIVQSSHTSTLEHLCFTFTVEGVSRSLLAQLTRHRVGFSYSVQSQRFVKFGSADKSGGFDYVTPITVEGNEKMATFEGQSWRACDIYTDVMETMQNAYDALRSAGVPAEDARAVLPNAACCNLTMTANLRSLMDFYGKRNPNTHAQNEIQNLATALKDAVIAVEPWTEPFFK